MSLVGVDELAEVVQMQTTSGLSSTVQSKHIPNNSILNFFLPAEPNRIEKRKNEETTPADVKRKIMNSFQLKTVENKSIVSISKSTTSDPIKHGSDKHLVALNILETNDSDLKRTRSFVDNETLIVSKNEQNNLNSTDFANPNVQTALSAISIKEVFFPAATNEPKVTKKCMPMSVKAHSKQKVLDIG